MKEVSDEMFYRSLKDDIYYLWNVTFCNCKRMVMFEYVKEVYYERITALSNFINEKCISYFKSNIKIIYERSFLFYIST